MNCPYCKKTFQNQHGVNIHIGKSPACKNASDMMIDLRKGDNISSLVSFAERPENKIIRNQKSEIDRNNNLVEHSTDE